PEKFRSHFRLDDRQLALKGGDNQPNDIVPGDARHSRMMSYVNGGYKDVVMPPPEAGQPLSAIEIGILWTWINQGAPWGTNRTPALVLDVAPGLGWTGVHGDKKKFRELEGVQEGPSGGIGSFSVIKRLGPDETFSMEGHALFPQNDIKLVLALDRSDYGFIHGGFEEWRKYADDTGGYYPGFSPSSYSLNRDLYEDIGRVWMDFGLTLPDTPHVVLGYELQFRQGTESTLVWGTVNQGSALKNIYPNTAGVDEHTHIIKFTFTHEWEGWAIEDRARMEAYSLKKSRDDVLAYSTGPNPDLIERNSQTVRYTLGANTFRVEKQLTDWWLLSAGSLLSRYDGLSSFNQTAVDGSGTPTFGTYWNAQGIILERDARVVSVGSLFLPIETLSISAAVQGDWTHEEGFGDVNLDIGTPSITPFPGTVSANQDRTEYSESFNARFTGLPLTVLFADGRLQQESVGQFDEANNTLEPFQQRTDAQNRFYDLRAGFTVSPWTWFEAGGHVRRRDSVTDYDHFVDTSPAAGEGYPAFIRHRDIALDEIEGRIVLRPARWINLRLTYDWNKTDFSTVTDGDTNGFYGIISPGGSIFDGRTTMENWGLHVALTPVHRFYLSGNFTYGFSRTRTTPDAAPEVVAYSGNIYTVAAAAGYVINAKTELNAGYDFSKATYGQNNTAGVPLGLDFTRNELWMGLNRQLTKNWSGTLRYQFSQYREPSSANVNNFTAHGIFATCMYRWP
ncbi:MAG TPA: c-type cytochrome domain-containing protein, partial [Desulfuromonadaceae bacterium]|nr:c-type cytochrome domain-containing protein [Desulfuromonadaceae bacterium]